MSYFNIGLIRGFSSTGFPTMNATRPDLLPDKAIWSWAGKAQLSHLQIPYSINLNYVIFYHMLIRLHRSARWLLRHDSRLSAAPPGRPQIDCPHFVATGRHCLVDDRVGAQLALSDCRAIYVWDLCGAVFAIGPDLRMRKKN